MMVTSKPPKNRPFAPISGSVTRLAVFGVVASVGWGFFSRGAAAQEAAGPESIPIDPIPASFELWQDRMGFLWQLSRQGALSSGDSSYLQAALSLHVRGAAFAPDSGRRLDGGQATEEGARVVLSQQSEGLAISRDIWFDQERAGVRVLDSFTNTGQRKATFRIDLKTTYQNPWQDLHGTEGRILGARPGSGLDQRDFGVVVKFSAAEGRHDTLFVTSSERDGMRPMVSYSSNLRELTFSYDLEIGPGMTARLLHWGVQRNLQVPSDAVSALKPFYQRRQLIDPGVNQEAVADVRNFEAPAFPEPGVTPFDLEGLVSMNAALESSGAVRRGEDVLWISSENQLSGSVNPKAVLRVNTSWGDREASITEVAAIQGGSGLGRTPRVFLRDGRVWSGAVTATDLTIKVAEDWEVDELRPEEITLLLLKLAAEDGKPPEGASLFVELRTGDVIAVDAGENASAPLTVLTPWGEDRVPLDEVRELQYATGAMAPKFRLLREGGTAITVFLGQADLTLRELSASGAAEPISVSPVAVAGVWRPGQGVGSAAEALEDEWFDLEDARSWSGKALPSTAVLLTGNNLLNGQLGIDTLFVVSGAAVTPVESSEVISMRRSPDSDSDAFPVFEIELNGGEVLTGRLRERLLPIESGGREWRVPAKHFIAFQRQAPVEN